MNLPRLMAVWFHMILVRKILIRSGALDCGKWTSNWCKVSKVGRAGHEISARKQDGLGQKISGHDQIILAHVQVSSLSNVLVVLELCGSVMVGYCN